MEKRFYVYVLCFPEESDLEEIQYVLLSRFGHTTEYTALIMAEKIKDTQRERQPIIVARYTEPTEKSEPLSVFLSS